ncbi:MAG: hypothetical protein JO021_24580 [Alphaproteobacteria bacterium]|nr:hypothetical protein [Alphaproteobacteria bacterium]
MPAKSLLLTALLVFGAGPALAQGGTVITPSGTVEKFDVTSISVKTDQGTVETFKLAPNVVVVQNKKATLADIKPNDFVASAAMLGADGKLHSTELRIFPEAMRGVGEGQRPMNDPKNQTMTNATVTGTAIVNGSNTVKVKFPGGEGELIVDPGVPVTRIDEADKSLVKPGAKVLLRGARTADGAAINRITVE